MCTDIRESQNYVWSINNLLGEGATSEVYKGYDKRTGTAVAIKSFKRFYLNHPSKNREFEVLQKIQHENIVKLLAIETEVIVRNGIKHEIIVTELCTGGSLSSILDHPENCNGLDDSEFLLVLSHLTAGIEYLRGNNLVHRDLKPGNIMKYIKNDGSSLYKLIDFGGAREISDDKGFHSLFGTEEYLNPDIYEKAMLNIDRGKSFYATVDLWSIGATLFHVATGSIPFRTYINRKNKELMHAMTTRKESGVISGIQHDLNGPVYWSKTLPANCCLSGHLKAIITPLLAGLLESNRDKIWSFQKYFDEVDSILSRKTVHIFFVTVQTLVKVYWKPDEPLQETIHEIIPVAPENQVLLYHSSIFTDKKPPITNQNCPLFMWSNENDNLFIPQFNPSQSASKVTFSTPINLRIDDKHALLASTIGYETKRLIGQCVINSELINKTVINLSQYLRTKSEVSFELCRQSLESIKRVRKTAGIFEVSQSISDYKHKTNFNGDLKKIVDDFTQNIANPLHEININHLETEWNNRASTWKSCSDIEKSLKRAQMIADDIESSRYHLAKGREIPIPHTEQYKLERKHILKLLEASIKLLEVEVYPQHKARCEGFAEWFRLASSIFKKLEKLDVSLKLTDTNFREFEKKMDEDIARFETYIKQYQRVKPKFTNQNEVKEKLQQKLATYTNGNESNNIIKENRELRATLYKFTLDLDLDQFTLE